MPSSSAATGATYASEQGYEQRPLIPHLLEPEHPKLHISQLTKKGVASQTPYFLVDKEGCGLRPYTPNGDPTDYR